MRPLAAVMIGDAIGAIGVGDVDLDDDQIRRVVVERECFESECAADPIRSSLDFIIRAGKVARFEEQQRRNRQ